MGDVLFFCSSMSVVSSGRIVHRCSVREQNLEEVDIEFMNYKASEEKRGWTVQMDKWRMDFLVASDSIL